MAMKFSRRQFLHLATGAAAPPALSRTVAAQSYPSRPIRLVIPFPPGGINDAVGRPWADKAGPLLGPVVVENIGGAGSTIGVAAVARAQPDGYTLLIGNSSNQVIAPIASSRLPYDPLRDFDAIYRLAVTGLAIAVHPSIPAHNLKDLVDYAKANRGKLAYASAGVGTTNHFVGEMFKLATSTPDITHVPYRGAGPATNDLLGGQILLMWATVTGQLIQLHNSGKLRVLAVTSPKRLIGAPEIPTAIEAGFPDLVWEGFVGLFTPKGTPAPIIERIAQVTRTVLTDSDLQKNWIEAGMEPDLDSTPEKGRQFVEGEIRRWAPIVKATQFKLD
jgi:tripartite-type tricarboxylate transporter receptor subunit TctC